MSGLMNLFLASTNKPVIPIDNSVFVFDGNSLTYGQGGTPYPTQFALLDGITGKGCTFHNLGVSGQRTVQMIADFNTQVLPLYDPSKNCYYLVNEIGNEVNLVGVEQAMANFWQLCDMAKNAGFIVGVINLEDRTLSYYQDQGLYLDIDDNEYRQKLSDCRVQLVNDWSSHGDFFVDIFATTELSNAWNTTYFTDRVHNTTAGYGVWAREVRLSLFDYCNLL